MTNIKLKKHFPTFFKQNILNLRIAALGLSLPLILRGSIDFIRIYDVNDVIGLRQLSQVTGALWYPEVFFVVCDVIPQFF